VGVRDFFDVAPGEACRHQGTGIGTYFGQVHARIAKSELSGGGLVHRTRARKAGSVLLPSFPSPNDSAAKGVLLVAREARASQRARVHHDPVINPENSCDFGHHTT
jgi:hypothetical protein